LLNNASALGLMTQGANPAVTPWSAGSLGTLGVIVLSSSSFEGVGIASAFALEPAKPVSIAAVANATATIRHRLRIELLLSCCSWLRK
jgi:hypothetical protein